VNTLGTKFCFAYVSILLGYIHQGAALGVPKHVGKSTVCRVCLHYQCMKSWFDRLNVKTVFVHTMLTLGGVVQYFLKKVRKPTKTKLIWTDGWMKSNNKA
jgi:hypothetical protein